MGRRQFWYRLASFGAEPLASVLHTLVDCETDWKTNGLLRNAPRQHQSSAQRLSHTALSTGKPQRETRMDHNALKTCAHDGLLDDMIRVYRDYRVGNLLRSGIGVQEKQRVNPSKVVSIKDLI